MARKAHFVIVNSEGVPVKGRALHESDECRALTGPNGMEGRDIERISVQKRTALAKKGHPACNLCGPRP